jgi:hypothetical protein
MKITITPISSIKPNPNNPRLIKDDKFKKLVKSIQEFPEMLNLRPIVVNADSVVLGGNMRLKACKEAGLKLVPVIYAEDLTEEQQKQFIIKDNVGFGEWDWEDLANNWDAEQLTDWGLNIPNWSAGINENEMSELDLDMTEKFDPIGIKSDKKNVTFVFNTENDAKNYCDNNGYKIIIKGELWKVEIDSQSI